MPATPASQRQHEPAAVAQVAEVELAARLQPDDQEEQRHQAAVDPLPQVQAEHVVAEPDRTVGPPEIVVQSRARGWPRPARPRSPPASTPALPASVRRKARIGAANSRRQLVRPLSSAEKSVMASLYRSGFKDPENSAAGPANSFRAVRAA